MKSFPYLYELISNQMSSKALFQAAGGSGRLDLVLTLLSHLPQVDHDSYWTQVFIGAFKYGKDQFVFENGRPVQVRLDLYQVAISSTRPLIQAGDGPTEAIWARFNLIQSKLESPGALRPRVSFLVRWLIAHGRSADLLRFLNQDPEAGQPALWLNAMIESNRLDLLKWWRGQEGAPRFKLTKAELKSAACQANSDMAAYLEQLRVELEPHLPPIATYFTNAVEPEIFPFLIGSLPLVASPRWQWGWNRSGPFPRPIGNRSRASFGYILTLPHLRGGPRPILIGRRWSHPLNPPWRPSWPV